jgi:hypothetical protein
MERDISDNFNNFQSVSGLGNINANIGNTVTSAIQVTLIIIHNTLFIYSSTVQGLLVENKHI